MHWEIEVKPGKPYTYHQSDSVHEKLHVTQANLGDGLSSRRSAVACSVGNKTPFLLCSFLPNRVETCRLNLQFEGNELVVFSAVGLRSIRLFGFLKKSQRPTVARSGFAAKKKPNSSDSGEKMTQKATTETKRKRKRDDSDSDHVDNFEGNVGSMEDTKRNIEIDYVKKRKKCKTRESGDDVDEEKNVTLTGDAKKAIVAVEEKKVKTKKWTSCRGFIIEFLEWRKPATGVKASPGNKVSIHYTGKLQDGSIIKSNMGSAPFEFRLGIGQVIMGWDIGIEGMRAGEKRRLTIPPSLGYGDIGAGKKIPPNALLIFDIEMFDPAVQEEI